MSSARTRVGAGVTLGLLVGAGTATVAAWSVAVLVGWCTVAVVYLVWTMLSIRGADGEQTVELSRREDDSRAAADTMLVGASVASLVAVAYTLGQAGTAKGSTEGVLTGLAAASVVLSWLCIHVVFMFRYADLYFASPTGGVDFHGEDPPTFTDFAYLAFTVGMTYQVSDTDLSKSSIRHAALRHALLSFVFGTAIVAMTINIVAGLLGK